MNRAHLMRRFASIWIIATCPFAVAYETETHLAITSEATAQSSFSRSPTSSEIWNQLGIVDPTKFSFTTKYVVLGPNVTRGEYYFQANKFNAVRAEGTELSIPAMYSLTGWLGQGAIREDDNTTETPGSDEPGGVFDRVFAHWYDPEHNHGLTVNVFTVVTGGPRAVDWALLPNQVPYRGRENHFKISDAREAMWRALTLTTLNPDGTLNPNVFPTDDPTLVGEELRQAYWNSTFRTVGNVMHLLQDMAQPQHVRNEPHSGMGCISSLGTCMFGHASFYEYYTKARTLKAPSFTLSEGFTERDAVAVLPIMPDQLIYAGYPVPRFTSYQDYFGPGGSTQNQSGTGLANYTNRGFYSVGTNINSVEVAEAYPSPDSSSLFPDVVTGQNFLDMMNKQIPGGGSITLLRGDVQDQAFPDQLAGGVPLTSYGAWDQFLQPKATRGYSLNHYNYYAQADLLIKRAAAYSAGLLDYFFRGRMKISLPDSGLYAAVDHAKFAGPNVTTPTDVNGFVGFGTVRLKLQNTTLSIAPPGSQSSIDQQMGQGTLVAVAKFHRNTCYKDDLSGESGASGGTLSCKSRAEEIVVSRKIDVPNVPGNAKEYEFTFDQQIPINAQDLYLQVVFRGVLGQEQDAVVVATKDIAEPTYVTVINSSDYIKIAKHVYTRDQVNADQTLLNQVSPTSCVVNSQLKNTCSARARSASFSASAEPFPPCRPTLRRCPSRNFLEWRSSWMINSTLFPKCT
jgi:hypothetical protein